MAEQS
jgi:hypothetical protein